MPLLGTTRVTKFMLPLVAPLLLLFLWWGATAVLSANPRIFPSPAAVAREIAGIVGGSSPLGSAYDHAGATFYRIVVAFSISILLGTALGITAGRVKIVFDALSNFVWIFLAVPSVVWVFILAVSLGIGNVVPIAALVALLAPRVVIIVAEGAKSTPKDILEMADAFKIGWRQRLFSVYLPYLLPYVAGSARVCWAYAIKIAVVAEVIGLTAGIGYLLIYFRDTLYMAPIIAWALILVFIGSAVDRLVFARLENRVAQWRSGAVAEPYRDG